jgi:hypothetical protein
MWIIPIIFILTSCSTRHYSDTANLILVKESKKICREENMKVFGIGGSMQDRITRIIADFTAKRTVDIAEARRLIVKCIEGLRSTLNTHDQIKEYLSPYPFSANEMDVSVAFIKENDAFVEYGCSVVYQMNGSLYYASYNLSTRILENFYEEPYDVALEIIRNNGALNTPCNL